MNSNQALYGSQPVCPTGKLRDLQSPSRPPRNRRPSPEGPFAKAWLLGVFFSALGTRRLRIYPSHRLTFEAPDYFLVNSILPIALGTKPSSPTFQSEVDCSDAVKFPNRTKASPTGVCCRPIREFVFRRHAHCGLKFAATRRCGIRAKTSMHPEAPTKTKKPRCFTNHRRPKAAGD